MNYLIQKTFENRGYTQEFLDSFDMAEHGLLKDIDVLVQTLKDAHDMNEHITILPDFDMDGISSGVLGYAGLAELGFNVSLFIPDPSEGYGFGRKTLDRLMEQYPDTKYILTCDTGIGEADSISYAVNTLGVNVLVTDHHMQQVQTEAMITVDPLRQDEEYAHAYICGAYVLYQVLERYAQIFGSSFEQMQIERLKVFAGVGTVSDSMKLWYENRQLVRDSLSISRLLYNGGSNQVSLSFGGCEIYRRALYGMYVVLDSFAKMGKIKDGEHIHEDFYGFYMAPVFNSVKRMNGDLIKAFSIFFGDDQYENMKYLARLNEKRKKMIDTLLSDMMAMYQPFAPYIYLTDASSGLVGLLASKLMGMTGVPTYVVARHGDSFSGSGRSPEWYLAVSVANSLGIYAAGHASAFGIRFNNGDEVKALYEKLVVDVPAVMETLEIEEAVYDFIIDTSGHGDVGIDIPLFQDYLDELENYRPFGNGFASPQVLLKFSPKLTETVVMGKSNEHLKFVFSDSFSIVCFGQSNKLGKVMELNEVQVVGHLDVNEFRGIETMQFLGDILLPVEEDHGDEKEIKIG